MRGSVWATVLSLSLAGLCSAQSARGSVRKPTDIPPEPLDAALQTLAKSYDFQVLYRTEIVRNLQTAGAVGSLTSDEALTRVLSGTGLAYKYLDAATVTIVPVAARGAPAATAQAQSPHPSQDATKEVGKQSSQDFRLAQVDQGSNQGSAAVAQSTPSGGSSSVQLQEVVVTAQKKEERLQDVPVPVTALDAQTLTSSNLTRLQDYSTQVPGLNVAPMGIQSAQLLSIRGITTGGGSNPTVAITIDGVPYGSSTNLGGGTVVPDVDPGDLARVEVLRGPQGTLYGASSLGGLIDFVTVDPSTQSFSGRIEGGLSGVYHGAEAGYDVRASLNLPLTDVLALQVSAFTRQDPGYIDNPLLGADGINEDHVTGGRLALLWKPAEDFSIKWSALLQDTRADGSSDVDVPTAGFPQTAGLADLQQDYIPGVGGYERKVQAYSMTVKAKLAGMELTSISGFNINSYNDSWDYSYALGSIAAAKFGGVTGSPITDDNNTRKFTEELRLAAPIGTLADVLVGAFYTHEDSKYSDAYLAENAATGAVVGQGLAISFPTTYEEYAGFADATLHISDRFDVQIGGRESQIRQTFNETEAGPYAEIFFAAPSVVVPQESSKENAFTYLLTPRFKLSQDAMIYARLASGYRAGGPNAREPGEPSQYDPDRTYNYEIGAKADFLDHRLSLDGSIYYIDWKNIQLQLLDPSTGQTYTTNAGRAKSEGTELSLTVAPLAGLSLTGWVVWNEAILRQSFPATSTAYGVSGDQLPYSSRFSGNLSAEYDMPLGPATGFIGGAGSYVGAREGVFGTVLAPQRQEYGPYARFDLRAGLRYDSWTGTLFVTNLTDRRGVLSGGIGSFPPYAFTYIQPRAVGFNVTRTF